MAARSRDIVARTLFNQWVGATEPEILGVLWHNLSRTDRQVWLDRADEKLKQE